MRSRSGASQKPRALRQSDRNKSSARRLGASEEDLPPTCSESSSSRVQMLGESGVKVSAEELFVFQYLFVKGDIVIDMGCGPGFFSIEMAKMVGQNGRVVAVDLQEKMLGHVKRKAAKHGVTDRMEFHQCRADHIALSVKADFMLAYYMVHETPGIAKFFVEAASLLRQGGRMLVVEPRFHVTRAMFAETLGEADKAGLTAVGFPKGKGSRSVLFVK